MRSSEQLKRHALLFKAMTDPLWLGREIMGYTKLTDEFHGPIMQEMWDRDLRRPLMRAAIKEQCDSGKLPKTFYKRVMEEEGGDYTKNEALCAARSHYKTTMLIVRCAKNILLWPEITISHWHAVEKNATECSLELGNHFQKNQEFRKLRMEIMPDTRNQRFNTSSGFTVKTLFGVLIP